MVARTRVTLLLAWLVFAALSGGRADAAPSTTAFPGILQNAATVNGNGGTLAVGGQYLVVTFTVSGTFVATVNFRGQGPDGSSFQPLGCTPVTGGGTVTSTTTTGAWRCNITGFAYIQAPISGYVSGTVTVAAVATDAGSVQVAPPFDNGSSLIALPGYAAAALPVASTPGRLARVTDGASAGAMVVDDGNAWNCDAAKAQKLIIVTCPPYNARGDGTTDDTSAVNSALAALSGGGVLVVPGSLKTGDVTFPAHTGWIVIRLQGTWTVTSTLHVPAAVSIEGITGSTGCIQFQQQPCARILSSGMTNVDLIQPTGATFFKQLSVYGPPGGSALNTHDADNVVLESVGLNAANAANSVGLTIDSSIWMYCLRCAITAGTNSLATLLITDASSGGGQGAGIIYIDQLNISGAPITVQGGLTTQYVIGGMTIRGLIAENMGALPVFKFSNTKPAQSIWLDSVSVADSTSSGVFYAGTANTVHQLLLTNSGFLSTPLVDPASKPLDNLTLLNTPAFPATAAVVKDFAYLGGDLFDGKPVSLYGAPAIPVTAETVTTAPASWTLVNDGELPTITTGQIDPMGGANAGKLSVVSGRGYARPYNQSKALAVGDWFIIGAWVQLTTQSNSTSVGLNLAGSGFAFDNGSANLIGANVYTNTAPTAGSSQWIPVVAAGKIATIGTNPTTVALKLSVDGHGSANNVAFFNPWVIYVPVASGYADSEVLRWSRYLQTVTSGAPAGFTSVATNGLALGRTGGFFSGVLSNSSAYAAIANANSETYFAIGADGKIPAGAINGAKHRIECTFQGVYSDVLTPTLDFKVKLCTVSGCGSGTVVTLGDTQAVTLPSGATNQGWEVRTNTNVFTAGAGGTLKTQGWAQWGSGIGATVTDDITNTGIATVDTTVDQYLSESATWSVASASNTVTLDDLGCKVY